jgi:hypothetical protein
MCARCGREYDLPGADMSFLYGEFLGVSGNAEAVILDTFADSIFDEMLSVALALPPTDSTRSDLGDLVRRTLREVCDRDSHGDPYVFVGVPGCPTCGSTAVASFRETQEAWPADAATATHQCWDQMDELAKSSGYNEHSTGSSRRSAYVDKNGPMLSIDPHSGIQTDQVVQLDLGVRPSPAGSGELLLHTEGPDAILVLLVVDRDSRRVGPAIVTFVRCRQSVFGYPNDEAQWGDSRLRGRGYGFFEVCDSPWPGRLDAYNRQAFPARTVPQPLRHFGVACHENLGEFLAEDIRMQLWPDPFEDAVREALRRLLD